MEAAADRTRRPRGRGLEVTVQAEFRRAGRGRVPGGVAEDREEAARPIRRYDLRTVPVVDVLMEEASEDIQRFGGTAHFERGYLDAGFPATMPRRAGRLTVLFVGEMPTATAMRYFEGEPEKPGVRAIPPPSSRR